MGLNRDCDIDAAQRKTVLALLERHLPNTAAWAYGSRAKWTARPQSDLDMVVFASPEQNGQVSHLREAFEESNLPFRVDLFVWDAVPEKFRKQIEAEHVVLVEKKEQYTGRGRRTVTLGDCAVINDSTYSPKEAWPFVNYLDTGNITGNRIAEIQHLIVGKDKVPSRARRKVQPGDIVYSTVRPNQRHFGLLREIPENFLASTGFSVIRGKNGFAHTNFIYWFLTQDHIVEQLHTIAEHSTSAYPSIRPADIERLRIDLPPLPEQRAIARILGALDDKIELNRRMNETLEAMARALFRSWFVDFDPVRAKMAGRDPNLPKPLADLFPDRLDNATGLPVGWQAKPLDGIAEFINGLALQKYPATSHQESLPVIKIAELRNGISSKSNRASFEIPEKYIIKNGDFLFSWSGSLMAKFWTEGEGALNQHLFKVTSEHYPPWFYANWVYHHLEQFQAIAAAKATTMGHIQRSHLRAAMTNCPPHDILVRLDAGISPLIDRLIQNELESCALATLRDALLPKLVSGELRVNPPEAALRRVDRASANRIALRSVNRE